MEMIVSKVLNCPGKYGQPTWTVIRQPPTKTAQPAA